MSVFKLHSKLKKSQEKQEAANYQYGYFPKELRVQICQILDELLKKGYPFFETDFLFDSINNVLCKEYGVFSLRLTQQPQHLYGHRGSRELVLEFVLNVSDVNKCLDVLQVTFSLLAQRNLELGKPSFMEFMPGAVEDAIAECNERFKEHLVGFQFVGGQFIRIDSDFTHQELTMPALKLLEQDYLKGANEEFLAALDHHRHGRNKESLNECLKAFESTMKAICHKRKWPYGLNDTAKTLIGICGKNNLFPVFMENHLTGLRMTLEAGVPTARNKTSGHGQGVMPIKVSPEFASYILNLTASNIRFLVSSEQALP